MFSQPWERSGCKIHLFAKGESALNTEIISIRLMPQNYETVIRQMLEILLPDYSYHFLTCDESVSGPVFEVELKERRYDQREPIVTQVRVMDGETVVTSEERSHDEILDERYDAFDYERRGKDLMKTHTYTFLVRYLQKEMSPWGILSGIRPTKILHYLRDKGFAFEEIREILREVYAISGEKIQLLERIGHVEETYLPTREEAAHRVSIYIGIPFCPSRCSYCSFPAFSLQKHGRFMEPFLKTLFCEVERIGRFIREKGYQVDSIYLGGGTPTSLTTAQIEALLQQIATHVPMDHLLEYNVEAGRPDTLSQEKLKALYRHGVRRISINPQTMQQKTLDAIGRHHTVEEIRQVFAWAKEAGFPNINMDLIIGLPGEVFADVESTIAQITALKPDSVTVHTLSLKKASSWWETARNLPFPGDEEVSRMLEYIRREFQSHGLLPYYMYRQKYILGNQENVGYSVAGKESLYNMLMIDERETVIGLGGGAVTKVVNPSDWSLLRYANPKYPGDYIRDIDQILEEKLSLLTSFQ